MQNSMYIYKDFWRKRKIILYIPHISIEKIIKLTNILFLVLFIAFYVFSFFSIKLRMYETKNIVTFIML